MSPFDRALSATWRYAPLLLIVGAAFLLSHPFAGVRHDGILYAGEALARLLPGQFNDDPYFRFGSQGRFTLMPAVYAALISAFGVGRGTIFGMLFAFAAYLAASTYLVARIVPSRLLPVCLLSVVLGWTVYGGHRVFAYSEAFLTARSFAEPAVLLALGLLLRGRRLAAMAALLLAIVIHPLIAAAGVVIAWLLLVQQDRRWLIIGGLGVVAYVVLGAVQAGPFADAFTRYDETWLSLVRAYNPQAFVTSWSVPDYGIVVFDVSVLWLMSRLVDDTHLTPFVRAVVLTGVGAIVVSCLTVDLALNPFFGKLQLWRAEWVLQWLAMASLPVVLVKLWQRGEAGRIAACFLALGWIAPFTDAPALLGVMAIAIDAMKKRLVISVSTTRIVQGVVALAVLVLVAQYESRVWKMGVLLEQSWPSVLGHAFGMNLLLFAIAFGLIRAVPYLSGAAPILALLLFLGALALWDQRSPWTRTLEAYTPGTPLWQGLIEPDAKVYWYRDLFAPWVLLGHGNYYTAQQGSGAVFSRDMTMELDRRSRLTGILDMQEQICRMMNSLNGKQSSCEPDAEAVRQVCRDGGVNYVVLQSHLAAVAPLAEVSTGVVEEGYEKRFFLYRCAGL